MNQSRYRSLVLATFLLCCTSSFLDLLVPGLLPPALAEALRQQYATDSTSNMVYVTTLAWASFAAMCIGMFGLWQFRAWAPRFAVLATLLLVFTTAQVSGFAQSGLAFSIHAVSWLAWGAALLVPFLGPYSGWFKSRARASAVAA